MKKILFILFIFPIHLTAFCQSLTLQDAINIALKKSLDLQLLKNNVEISRVNNNIGVAGGLPIVTAGASDNEQSTNVNQELNTEQSLKEMAQSAIVYQGILLQECYCIMAPG